MNYITVDNEGWKVNWSDRRSHILKAYMIKRKAGRADWGELPRNYALSNDLSRVSTLISFAQRNNLTYLGEAKKMLTVVEDDIDKMNSSLADLQKAKSTIEEAIEALGPLKKYKPAYDDYQSGIVSKWVIGHFLEKDIKAYEEAKTKVDAAAKYGKTDKKSLKAMLKSIDSEISQTKWQIQLKDMDAEILTDIQEFAGWVLPKKEKIPTSAIAMSATMMMYSTIVWPFFIFFVMVLSFPLLRAI